jgi:hypothetical protein
MSSLIAAFNSDEVPSVLGVVVHEDIVALLRILRAVIRPQAAGSGLQVAVRDGRLRVEAGGPPPVLDFEKGAPIEVVPRSSNEFLVDGGDRTRPAFLADAAGKPTSLVVNPRPWQIIGQRINWRQTKGQALTSARGSAGGSVRRLRQVAQCRAKS